MGRSTQSKKPQRGRGRPDWLPAVGFLAAFVLLYYLGLHWPTSAYNTVTKTIVILGLSTGVVGYLVVFGSLIRYFRLEHSNRDSDDVPRLVSLTQEMGGPFFLTIWSGFFNIMVFATAYRVLEILDANSFSQAIDAIGAVYFSVVTIFTVGYGDIFPLSHAARIVVVAQICLGFLTLALLGNALTQRRI